MTRKHSITETYPREWRQSASDVDLDMAIANLELAVATAREAGRPVTADAILHEVRDIETQRQKQLFATADASRDCVAYQADDPGIGMAEA